MISISGAAASDRVRNNPSSSDPVSRNGLRKSLNQLLQRTPGTLINPSVYDRMRSIADYRPLNLPTPSRTEDSVNSSAPLRDSH